MDSEDPKHRDNAAANIIMLVKGLLNNMDEDGLKRAVDALTKDIGGHTDQFRSTVLMMLDQNLSQLMQEVLVHVNLCCSWLKPDLTTKRPFLKI